MITKGRIDHWRPEEHEDSAIIDVLKVRLFSPESKSGVIEGGDHFGDSDMNPIWGKARDLEKMMRYNPLSEEKKLLLRSAFFVSFSRKMPWIKNKHAWMLFLPKIWGGLGLHFGDTSCFKKSPRWHRQLVYNVMAGSVT